MKQMSDVFELPVIKPNVLQRIGMSEKEIDRMIYAAHAINHVDALAEVLEDLMEWHVKNVHVLHHPTFDRASKALAAYRGEE